MKLPWGAVVGGILGSVIPGVGTALGAGLGGGIDTAASTGDLGKGILAGIGGYALGGMGGEALSGMMGTAADAGLGSVAQGMGDAATQGAVGEAANAGLGSMASSMPMNGGAQLGLTGANVGTGMSMAPPGGMMQGGAMNAMGAPPATAVTGGPMPSAQSPSMFSKMASNPMTMMAMAPMAAGLFGGKGGGGTADQGPGAPLGPVQPRKRVNGPMTNGYSGGFGGGQYHFAQGGLAQLHSPEHPMGRIMMLRQSYGSRQEALADLMQGQGPAAELLSGPDDPTLMYAFGEGGRYVKGEGDGMSDDVPATIEGQQPAALADGEYVIPADAVSHVGNGSSDAGAKKLDQMVQELRKARTGRPGQAPQINAEQYLMEV